MERRGARLPTEIEIVVSDGLEKSKGVITEISRSGALIEAPNTQASVGARVELSVTALAGRPIQLEARVVRSTDGGFAVEFTWAPVDLLLLIDQLGAR